jgi:hypothetical protein
LRDEHPEVEGPAKEKGDRKNCEHERKFAHCVFVLAAEAFVDLLHERHRRVQKQYPQQNVYRRDFDSEL